MSNVKRICDYIARQSAARAAADAAALSAEFGGVPMSETSYAIHPSLHAETLKHFLKMQNREGQE